MNDLISRQTAIDELVKMLSYCFQVDEEEIDAVETTLKNLPTVEPKIEPITYTDCSNAMMKMWIDNVVTDGEYNRIMDKLNNHEKQRRAG